MVGKPPASSRTCAAGTAATVTIDDTEYDLPEGEIFHHPESSSTRGYGIEQIKESTGLSEAAIKSALTSGTLITTELAEEEVVIEDEKIIIEDKKVIIDDRVFRIGEEISLLVSSIAENQILVVQIVRGAVMSALIVETDDDDDDGDPNNELEVHFIDVGKGSSILVNTTAGETMLIDAGSTANATYGPKLLSYLQSEGISQIDYLIMTHNHEDHINIVPDLVDSDEISISSVYYSGIETDSEVNDWVMNTLREEGLQPRELSRGDGHEISLTGADVEVLNPPSSPEDRYSDTDANSIVLRISHEGESFLFTSDIRGKTEEDLAGSYGDVTVLQASHHGSSSRGANSDLLLRNTNPDYAVISSSNNVRDPPDDNTFSRLSEYSIPTYWTAIHGNVKFIIDDGEVEVETDRNRTTDPGELKKENE